LECNGIFPTQLHSKSGFIFYNSSNSGIYYSTSGYEIPFSAILSKYSFGVVSIYLTKHFTSLSLAEIRQLFKMDYSIVSKVTKRFEQESKVNYKIGKIKQKVITALKEN